MKATVLIALGIAGLGAGVYPVVGASIGLFDFAFEVDGVLTSKAFPAGVNGAALNTGTGLGSVQVTIGGAGAHTLAFFVDHEIDEVLNTYFNETGASSGSPGVGQSWEIDEPGFVAGDIYGNLAAGTLDDGIGTSIHGATVFPDDVSMALGYDFTLAVAQTAHVTFTLDLVPPPGGFYLAHSDPDSGAVVYFSGDLLIIPEPTLTWLASSLGMLILAGARTIRRRKAG